LVETDIEIHFGSKAVMQRTKDLAVNDYFASKEKTPLK